MIMLVDKSVWTKELKSLYQKYPASIRSSNWAKIVRLANSGDLPAAVQLAREHQDLSVSTKAENIIARRVRIQRVALFALQNQTRDRIKAAFEIAATVISEKAASVPIQIQSLAFLKKKNHEAIIELRRALNTILTDSIWKGIILGVKNMGEAIRPILKDNQESFTEELAEIDLIEGKLTFGMATKFASRSKGHVLMGSDKWTAILDGLYEKIAKSSLNGMNLSERIWEITAKMEMDLRRSLATQFALGKSAREIAKSIKDYVTAGANDAETGIGVYKSPLKNALRVARTETSRAYTQATAAWAQNKPWVKGIRVTLSPAHEKEDECDDLAGEIYSPADFADILPVHPHCMCFGVYVLDEKNLIVEPEED